MLKCLAYYEYTADCMKIKWIPPKCLLPNWYGYHRLLTVADIASVLRLKQSRVVRLMERGEIPAVHIGRWCNMYLEAKVIFYPLRFKCSSTLFQVELFD